MAKLDEAFEKFDTYNKQAPEKVNWDGVEYPSEYFYALRLHEWVTKLNPEAGEPLLLASRSQHIGRWEIARSTYPEGRVGYLKWRSDLSKFHAEKATEILDDIGYEESTITRVTEIIRKQKLKTDPDVQTIEDALCIVFLIYQFDDLILKLSEEKMIDILQKTWKKMSEAGQSAALQLSYSDSALSLLKKALGA
ncbi:DUF4202 domain-containing protein [Dyadobacter luteus]|jgi:hypothetical protein|uniref:DUF4202 domain-containing protein n=1 Tax=Dyadobacter luteus TaxID=2259619 RepID=A0A3D8Y460_9BACT|nr:DUF4202 domain-containing protein [Dyadobacter luteus]REA57069.1 DUF4202 domain-containing protein [Dyadobacter luteus]